MHKQLGGGGNKRTLVRKTTISNNSGTKLLHGVLNSERQHISMEPISRSIARVQREAKMLSAVLATSIHKLRREFESKQ